MDQNNPARFLDTAYNALKSNPNATNQILQAAAQGQPVGLRGLAAAAAQQSQQEAQKTMAALQQQGPQPNVIQKLAHAGIMSQMDTGLPGAPVQQEMPQQMMAGGGLVAFAGGGNVLPPDVIDAIQSHFAEGGDVRGFVGGDEIMALLRGASEELPYGELGSFIEGPGATPRAMPADYGPMGSFIEGAPREAPSKLDVLKRLFASRKSPIMTETQKDKLAKQINWNMIEGGGEAFPSVPESVSKLVGRARPAAEFLAGKVATPLAILSDPVLQAATKANVGLAKAAVGGENAFAESPVEKVAYHLPEYAEKGVGYLMDKVAPAGEVNESISKKDWEARRTRPVPVTDTAPATPTWQADPDPHTGTRSTPKDPVNPEGAKLDKTFDQAKVDTGTKTTDKEVETGLGALAPGMDMEKMRDLIAGLRGHKEMSPELAAKLEDLQSSARTSTIFQSLLGGLAGGLSNPYGGRFALGQAALGALGGYQKGSAGEEELDRSAFNILKGYADAPAEEQAKAVDMLFSQLGKSAELESEERRAVARAAGGLSYEERKDLIERRAQLGKEYGSQSETQRHNLAMELDALLRRARENAPLGVLSPEQEAVLTRKFYADRGLAVPASNLGGNISASQAGGLGGNRIIIQ